MPSPKLQSQLRTFFQQKAAHPARCAHVAVDVQDDYAWDEPAHVITQTLAPAFRRMAIPTYWAYMANAKGSSPEAVGLRQCPPPDGDVVFRKETFSSFRGTGLDDALKQKNVNTLILTGFMLSVCIKETLRDARAHGYNVILVRDATDEAYYGHEENKVVQSLTRDTGVIATYADILLPTLRGFKP